MTEQNDDRPRWKRGALWLAGAVAVPAIAWFVVQGLDEGKKTLDEELPISISVEADASRVRAPNDPGWETYGFVSRSTPTQLGQPPSELCREWRAWALDNGGVDADQTRLYAFLQGKTTTAVAITGLDVEFTRRGPALKGTHAWCPAGGAVGSPRLIDIDLDAEPPAVRYAETGDDHPSRDRLLLTLNGTETETLERRLVVLLYRDYKQSEAARQLGLEKREVEKLMRSIRAKMADWKPEIEGSRSSVAGAAGAGGVATSPCRATCS